MICQAKNVLKGKRLTGLISSPGHSSSVRTEELTLVRMEDFMPGKPNMKDEAKSDRECLNL